MGGKPIKRAEALRNLGAAEKWAAETAAAHTEFRSPPAMGQLEAVALSWVGTPFFPHGRVKGLGGGCSCQTLGFCIYEELGILPSTLPLPKLSLRSYRATRVSQIEKFIIEQLPDKFEHIEPDTAHAASEATAAPSATWAYPTLRPGDLLIFLDANTEHSGVYLGDSRFVHCLFQVGVVISNLTDATYLNRLASVWRPL